MLRARQALRIIDRFERVTAESRRATADQGTAVGPETDLESASRGLNNPVPEQTTGAFLEPVQEGHGDRTLQRPPSHTTVDIPDLATRDSATVSFSSFLSDASLTILHGAHICASYLCCFLQP